LGLLAHPRFAHPRLLLASLVFLYPKEAPCIPQRGAQAPYAPDCVEEEFSEVQMQDRA
jgi:hypothetical protein